MSILRITKHGEPVLKKVCPLVPYADLRPELPRLLKNMWSTMYSAKGVGLAAPQIGLNLRLSVVDVRPEGKPRRLVLLNPEIVSGEGVMVEDEGCLSVPGVFARVKRFARVRLRAVDAHGEPFELEATGLLAKAFQHEVDHLDGKLFIDRLPFTEKLRVLSLIKDLRRDWT